jgi:hypothetical protein
VKLMRVRGIGFLGLVLLAAAPALAEPPPRELYQRLNALRVDPEQIYFVRDVTLRRDAIRFSLTEGKFALLTAYDGRVLGAVFTGSGRVLAVPRDPVERRSLSRFVGEPLLDQPFEQAYLRFTDDTAEEIRRQLEISGARRLEEPSFVETWSPTLANLNPWHSLRAMMDLLSASPQPYFYAGIQSAIVGTFDVLVDSRREEPILIGQLRWVEGRRLYDVWASLPAESPGARPFVLPFQTVSTQVDTRIQNDLLLEAAATVRLRALAGGERVVQFEFSRNLQISAAADGAGAPIEFFQNDEVSREEVVQRGNDTLYLVLPEAPAAGEEFEVSIHYRGRVISDAGNNVYYVGERGTWFPSLAGPLQFAPFDLRFRWPLRLVLVATGRKVEEAEAGEWRTGRWISEKPITLAGFNLGDYLSERFESRGLEIEVFANRQLEAALLRRLRQPTILIPPPLPPQRRQSPIQLPRILMVEAPPAPTPSMTLRQVGQDVAAAIRYYEELLGPFPFERLAISQAPGSVGQGWPGLLYLSTLSFLPADAQRRAGLGEHGSILFSELMPYHEVAHQWWGNLVGIGSYRDQWVHEALADYLALLCAERLRSGERLLETWLENYRKGLTTPVAGVAPDEIGPLSLGYRLSSSRMPDAYPRVVYAKGAWVIHMLRMMLRDPAAKDPDAKFFGLLRGLVESHSHRALTTADVAAAVDRILPETMDLEGTGSADWFFEQWVRGTGIPSYTVEFQTTPLGNGFRIRGVLRQQGVSEMFIAPVPLYAAGATGRPVRLGVVIADGPETRFEFTARIRPRRILIDPENTLLRRD